jgi:hypothetical protein
MPGECTREVMLDLGACGHSGQEKGPGGACPDRTRAIPCKLRVVERIIIKEVAKPRDIYGMILHHEPGRSAAHPRLTSPWTEALHLHPSGRYTESPGVAHEA